MYLPEMRKCPTGTIERPEKGDGISRYKLDVKDDGWPRQMTSVSYLPDIVTPLDSYDTANFGNRLDLFLGSCYNSTAFMGQQAIKAAVGDLWLPKNSMHPTEVRVGIISTQPCDAQQFSSVM